MKAKQILILTFIFLTTIATQVYAEKWYVGGSLHQGTAGEWHKASYKNRLATSGDFITATTPEHLKNKLFQNDMAGIKSRAIALEKCISSATNDPKLYSMRISEIAASCLILLGFN